MENFYPPEEYVFDPQSGLYYFEDYTSDEAGNPLLIVTWFDTETGRYTQYAYPYDFEKGSYSDEAYPLDEEEENAEIVSESMETVPEYDDVQVYEQGDDYTSESYEQENGFVSNDNYEAAYDNSYEEQYINEPYQEQYVDYYGESPKESHSSKTIIGIICIAILMLIMGYVGSKARTVLFNNAEASMEKGDYDKAIKRYETILSLSQNEVYAYRGLAAAYFRKGEFEETASILADGYVITRDKGLLEQADEVKRLTGFEVEIPEELLHEESTVNGFEENKDEDSKEENASSIGGLWGD